MSSPVNTVINGGSAYLSVLVWEPWCHADLVVSGIVMSWVGWNPWHQVSKGPDMGVEWGMSPGSHGWDYFPCTRSCSEVTVTHLKIRHFWNCYPFTFSFFSCHNEANVYCQTSSISHALVGNKIFDHSDVVGAAPTLHLHSWFDAWFQWIRQRQLQDRARNI